MTLKFGATQSNGQTTGQWTIFFVPDGGGSVLSKGGTITGGHMSAQAYSLTGIENSNTLCVFPLAPIPATITISGVCGLGVTIQFAATNGEKATATGNVACS